MLYLVYMGDPKRSIVENITAALGCYRLKTEGSFPSFAAVHPEQACKHPLICVTTQADSAIIRRDQIWMPLS